MAECFTSSCSNALASSPSIAQIFTSSLNFLFSAQCILNEPWPEDSSNKVEDSSKFDFIIVGAGSAGCVLANRLTENSNWNVLLIEAGGDPPIDSAVPLVADTLQTSYVDWKYKTENDSRICQSMVNGKCLWPRGKMLGGSSSLNGLLYVRGNREDYDNMARQGNTGWNYDEVLKYFKKSENLDDPLVENDLLLRSYHGYNGPLHVGLFYNTDPMENTLTKGYEELGSTYVMDINGPSQYGTTRLQGTTYLGRRESTARAYLVPARNRKNLVVLKNTLAAKVLLESNKAVGVNILTEDGEEKNMYASKEVIISAGSINSPQLLMLSGIGPRKHLEEMGIKVITDLSVGENLFDHPNTPVVITLNKGSPPISTEQQAQNVAQYLSNFTGFYSTANTLDTATFINTGHQSNKPPNIQYHHLFFKTKTAGLENYCRNAVRYNDRLSTSIIKLNNDSQLLLLLTTLLHEKSRGKILLRSTNPTTHPKIYPNFFSLEEDVEIMIDGIIYATRIVNTKSFKSLGAQLERVDIPACNVIPFNTRSYWRCVIFNMAHTTYHPMGTIKMGPKTDSTAVVGPDLRVHTLKNLRVADGSVFPNGIHGNSNAPIIMLAEKAADLIKSDYK